MNENRNIVKVYQEAVHSKASLIDISENVIRDWISNSFPAIIAGILGFVTGVGMAQFLVDIGFWVFRNAEKIYASWMIGGALALVAFVSLYVFTVLSGGVRYYTEFDQGREARESPASAFIRTERRNQARLLPGKMRGLIITFATYFDAVGQTTGINSWETSGHLNRADITAVRDYLVDELQVATRDSRGGVTLNQWALEQLPEWAKGNFAGLVELASDPPTLGGA